MCRLSMSCRLLNGLEIGDKQLLVKAETKTKDMLAKHEAEQREQRQDYDDFCKQVKNANLL